MTGQREELQECVQHPAARTAITAGLNVWNLKMKIEYSRERNWADDWLSCGLSSFLLEH